MLTIIKIFDNIISTEKTILTQKNKAIAASLLVVISQLIFYIVVKQVVADTSLLTIWIISIASGIGSYIAFYINKKFSRDTVYINLISSNHRDQMKMLGDYLREEGIKVITYEAYGDTIEKTLAAIVFARTKEESTKIDKYMAKYDGFTREVV